MAPNKYSSSSTDIPTWLTELLQAIQRIQQDSLRTDSSIREIRSIALENQHLLRARLRTSLEELTQPAASSSRSSLGQPNPTQRITRVPPPVSSSRSFRQQTNEDVRLSALPLPRATRPNLNAVARICWYHRQFGQTSTNCIQPCSFKAPPLRVAHQSKTRPSEPKEIKNSSSVNEIRRVVLRHATSREPENSEATSSSSSTSNLPPIHEQQPTDTLDSNETTNNNPMDWNDENNLNYPKLSDSSSSSSGSDSDDSSHARKK